MKFKKVLWTNDYGSHTKLIIWKFDFTSWDSNKDQDYWLKTGMVLKLIDLDLELTNYWVLK